MQAPTNPFRGCCLPLILCILFSIAAAQQDGLVTIFKHGPFSSLRECAQNCFVSMYDTTRDLLGPRLRCSMSTLKSSKLAMNNCYCRPDLRPDAHEEISSCVSRQCPFNDNDIFTAQYVYDDYCSSNGYYGTGAQSPMPTQVAGGNGGDDGDNAGSNAAPGAGAGTQSQPTAGARSAANTASTVPAWLALLLAGTLTVISF